MMVKRVAALVALAGMVALTVATIQVVKLAQVEFLANMFPFH